MTKHYAIKAYFWPALKPDTRLAEFDAINCLDSKSTEDGHYNPSRETGVILVNERIIFPILEGRTSPYLPSAMGEGMVRIIDYTEMGDITQVTLINELNETPLRYLIRGNPIVEITQLIKMRDAVLASRKISTNTSTKLSI